MDNNQHKDLDQFFQNKLNDRQFGYQDDFWVEMESLLPEEDTDTAIAGNARRRFIGGILLIWLIGFAGWLIYPFAQKSNKIEIPFSSKIKSTEVVNQQVASDGLNTEPTIIINQKSENNQNNINTAKFQLTDNQINVEKLVTTKKIKYDSVTKGMTKAVEQVTKVPNPSLDNKKDIGVSLPINEYSTKEIRLEGDNGQLSAGINNEKIVDESPKNKTIRSTDSLNPNIENGVFATIDNSNNQPLDYSYLKTFSLEDIIEKETNEVSKIEPTCDGCPYLPSLKSIDVGLVTGLSASQGWKNTLNNRANPSLDPVIGLRFEYASNPIAEWTWNAAILYWSRSSLNAQYGYDSTSYGFGATTVSRSINIEELHSISLPICAVYNKDQHQFMGGLNLNYLINAQSTTVGTGSFYNTNNIELFDVATTEQWGYTSAFNRFDVGLTVGYDYEVKKGWRLGTRINYGLTDVAKNNIFNNNTFDNNLNIRLLLTCDLLEFKF